MLALDFILIFLTLACIIYCWLLNKRILQIQQYRVELMQMFKEFDKSIVVAEKVLATTKQFTAQTENLLHNLEIKAHTLTAELKSEIRIADKFAAELELMISSGKKLHSRLAVLEESLTIRASDTESKDDLMSSIVPFARLSEPQTLSQQDYYEMLQKKRLIKNEN